MKVSQHTILYSTGIGDRNIRNRQRLFGFWHYKNVSLRIVPNKWQQDEPVKIKLGRLLDTIDEEHAKGNRVSLIGESAGASIVTQALKLRSDKLTAVILLCGKSQYPEKVGSVHKSTNPGLRPAVEASSRALRTLSASDKAKILNLHPLFDPIVPVAETRIPGVKDSKMPIIGHPTGIVFGMSVWSWRIVRFIRNRAKAD